jgi:beta-carotene 15,15'-dioxygenase
MQFMLNIITKTPTWLSVIVGSILLIWQSFHLHISQDIQVVFFVSIILLTGIPHGALDHLIQKETDKHFNRPYSFMGFLVKYLSIMALYALAWYWFSVLSFLFFLAISAWHFGETDIEKAPKNSAVWTCTRLVYGFYVLAFILLTHADEASPVVMGMVGKMGIGADFWQFIHQYFKQILFLLGLSLCTIFIVAQSQHFILFDKLRLLRLGIILLLAFCLPLLPAFALYFGGWHALCAFDTIHNYLRKDQPALSFKLVYSKALPFTLLAIIFLSGFLWYCSRFTHQFDPYSTLFIFISLITLPHLLIAHQMNHTA